MKFIFVRDPIMSMDELESQLEKNYNKYLVEPLIDFHLIYNSVNKIQKVKNNINKMKEQNIITIGEEERLNDLISDFNQYIDEVTLARKDYWQDMIINDVMINQFQQVLLNCSVKEVLLIPPSDQNHKEQDKFIDYFDMQIFNRCWLLSDDKYSVLEILILLGFTEQDNVTDGYYLFYAVKAITKWGNAINISNEFLLLVVSKELTNSFQQKRKSISNITSGAYCDLFNDQTILQDQDDIKRSMEVVLEFFKEYNLECKQEKIRQQSRKNVQNIIDAIQKQVQQNSSYIRTLNYIIYSNDQKGDQLVDKDLRELTGLETVVSFYVPQPKKQQVDQNTVAHEFFGNKSLNWVRKQINNNEGKIVMNNVPVKQKIFTKKNEKQSNSQQQQQQRGDLNQQKNKWVEKRQWVPAEEQKQNKEKQNVPTNSQNEQTKGQVKPQGPPKSNMKPIIPQKKPQSGVRNNQNQGFVDAFKAIDQTKKEDKDESDSDEYFI